ncbi:MAG: carbon monoxide dehydrogenase subunit G [Phaeodactylibacter sp.]|nr:carbon monoxide dehydrogenase subunit G [Phaeodactylibacter sp.]MCB9263855.1 carbon monoxide dehydrogenase subunit G [Lewinellaceae bacterium]
MHLKGTHKFHASANDLWSKLMDTDTLARITPGVSKLEEIGKDQYKAIAEVKMGPVSGSFSGNLNVQDKQEPRSFVLNIKQNSKIGNVAADVKIELQPVSDNETELSFDGKANLSGLLARTGQRVMSGVANTLSKQFFRALEEELANPGS